MIILKKEPNLRKLIAKSLFEQAYLLLNEYSIDDKWRIISNQLHREDPCRIYSFLRYLVAKDKDDPEWEYYCFVYLVYCNPFFDDSMSLSAWHLRRAMRLDNQNLEYIKQALSVFYTYNDYYFSDEEYVAMAQKILNSEPDYRLAQEIVKQHKRVD